MNNFKEGGFKKKRNDFGGKPKFGGDRGGNSRSGGSKFGGHKSGGRPSETFKAECSKCHKACTLPFRPTTDKPVFCSDCFAKKNAENDRSDGRRDGNRSDYAKPPRDQRPPRHDRSETQSSNELSEIKRQLGTIEARLNRILDIINPPMPAVKAVEQVKAEQVTEVKTPAKKVVKKAAKKAPTKIAPAKKVAKKAAKKVAPAKKAAKKVAPAKKAAKKVTKTKK